MPQSPDQLDLVKFVSGRWDRAYDGIHKRFRKRAEHFYALYRNYTDWRNSLPVDRRDRDLGLKSAQREWGAELFIPYAFSTVETILPRMLANPPSMLVKPRNMASEDNVRNVKFTLEAQQEQIDYELVLQDVTKDALIYGLGVQKVFWQRRERQTKRLKPAMIPLPGRQWVVQDVSEVLFDDPMVKAVDPFDFVWDPYAAEIGECEWVIHRTWRSTDYCKRQLGAEVWTGVDPSELTDAGAGSRYTEAMNNRMRIAGYQNFKADSDVHEVWEYHDGDRVITVLDRQFIVQDGANPAWHGEIPFQIYRPTKIRGQFVGVGEIEPIEDLQQEINTLRSQRRDNATLVLQKAFFYADGMVDPADFKIGPGRGVPTLGDPKEAVFPINFGDIPNSGYQEEAALQRDIERATGIDDSLAGSGSVGQTATGVQLVQAAANVRIQNKSRRCAVELVRAGARQMLALDQQKILTNREVRIPAAPSPMEPDRRWAWLNIGPAELAGEFDIDLEGGLEPDNLPQKRQDAQMMMQVSQALPLEPQHVTRYVLDKMGVPDPDNWIQQQGPPPLNPQTLDVLARAGVSQQLIQQAVQIANSNGGPNGTK